MPESPLHFPPTGEMLNLGAAGSSSGVCGTTTSKTIVLIRHAMSNENTQVAGVLHGVANVQHFRLPPLSCCTSLCSLLVSLSHGDSALSPRGLAQIRDLQQILESAAFFQKLKPDAIVVSPLTRARETAAGILPKDAATAQGLPAVQVLPDLEEASALEHVFMGSLQQRIGRFKEWLARSDAQTIVVVGHCQFFKQLVNTKFLMRNCDVWKCTLSPDMSWSEPQLLYRTQLSEAHPWSKLRGNADGDGGADTSAAAHMSRGNGQSTSAAVSGGELLGSILVDKTPRKSTRRVLAVDSVASNSEN